MDELLQALASELSLPRAGTMTVIVVRVVVAALLGGIILWLAASWAHGALGYMVAGVWRWVG